MIKVQDFIKYLKRNFEIKVTKSVYHSYDDCYFISPIDTSRVYERKQGNQGKTNP